MVTVGVVGALKVYFLVVEGVDSSCVGVDYYFSKGNSCCFGAVVMFVKGGNDGSW